MDDGTFSLMKERIREISGEEVVKEPYGTYFKTTAAFIMQVADLHKNCSRAGWKAQNFRNWRPIIRSCMKIFCLKTMDILMEIQHGRQRLLGKNSGSF